MSEKKLSALERLKVIAEEKINHQDSKTAPSCDPSSLMPINTKTIEVNNSPIFKSCKQEFKTISIDIETKQMIKELKNCGVPINNSALFRLAVKEFYNEWKKKK
ncbi:hypothetical protein [Spiroplasma endosymbiont of Megaselia nigra]|uniref:hypothetical protein n=1 Tax=Spiroplasma endosymbiont of Megaselia nigra TaxID=2478537 RepID=UPI000F866D68|nr:hypothetical protein [Spiroplasma endosymbiont of Megaselia nigra]RUO86431.1 hypothetical protein D9R21_03135 [Spiroplasma endosymbiont of Megaselia nigra]